jgi:hypothetical protein
MEEALIRNRREEDGMRQRLAEEVEAAVDGGDVFQRARAKRQAREYLTIPAQRNLVRAPLAMNSYVACGRRSRAADSKSSRVSCM